LHAYYYSSVQLREEDYPQRKRNFWGFPQKNWRKSRISFLCNIQRWIAVYTRRSSKLAQYAWNDENPRVTQLRNFQVHWKLNIWAEIMGIKILDPVILPEMLNVASYIQFLAENLPDFLEEVTLLNRNKTIFQQDGAGPYNARIVTNFLN